MPIPIKMPRLSDTMQEGTLIKWRVKVGDKVKADDVIADVETDKATMELIPYEDGTVAKLLIDEGQSAPLGQTILVLADKGESVEDAAKSAGSEQSAKPQATAKKQSGGKDQGGGTAVAEKLSRSGEDPRARDERDRTT